MKKTVLVGMGILLVVAMPVECAERGFYVGAGFGFSNFDVEDFNEEFANLYFESDNFGLKLFGGYQVFKYLAVEAGYTDFGQIKRKETNIYYEDQSLKVAINDWDVSAVGTVALGKKATLFAKIGMASWNTDVTVDDGHEVVAESSSGTDLAYGLGLDFMFKKFGLRLEGDWLKIPDTSGAFMLSGCLTYRF